MKTPTKAELYDKLALLEKLNIEMAKKAEKVKKDYWNSFLPAAEMVALRQLTGIFGTLLFNLRYEHVDESGYWFSFELVNDNRRQQYRVSHKEVSSDA